MKKISVLALIVTLISMAGIVHAGLPSVGSVTNKATDEAVDMGKHKALENEINNELKKQSCQFKDNNTHTDLNCDFDKVLNVISSRKTMIEGLDQGTLYTNIEVTGSKDNRYDRQSYLQDKANSKLSWARVSTNSVEGKDNNIKVWVEVK